MHLIEQELEAIKNEDLGALAVTNVEPSGAPELDQDYPPPPAGEKRSNHREELIYLRREFMARPKLHFLHAAAIVHIRRGIRLDEEYALFCRIWLEQESFLLNSLSSRWLISAADTIADCSPDKAERASAMAGALLLNTIKLYETEIRAKGGYRLENGYDTSFSPFLDDGMTTFWIGYGDVVINMKRRIEALCSDGTTASRILRELFERANKISSAYSRFRNVHTFEKTRW